jgi:hypothetical protein
MDVVYGGLNIRLPDFLIVGAARSGTTTMFSFLDRHPRVFMPREKEPMFFAAHGRGWSTVDIRTGARSTYVVDDLDAYLDLFRPAGKDQLLGEASTWYLYFYQTTVANIRRIYKDKSESLKILILLRNPVDRAWSHYLLKRRNGEESLPFEAAIEPEVVRQREEKHFAAGFDYIGFGRYFRQVESYLANFPRLKMLFFEEMREDLPRATREVCDFLGVEAPVEVKEKRLNVSGTPKNKLAGALAGFLYRPYAWKSFFKVLLSYKTRAGLKYGLAEKLFRPERLDRDLRRQLENAYREDILGLAALLKKDLSFWSPSPPEAG